MSKIAVMLLLAVSAVIAPLPVNGSELVAARQLMVVISNSWSDSRANMYRFEKINNGWKRIKGRFAVVVGEKGMGWGAGVSGKQASFPEKHEGDRKAPAGLFPLVTAMGYDAKAPSDNFPYQQIEEITHCVDDPDSSLYNKIVKESDFALPITDLWKSSERMKRKDNLYKRLVVVDYNMKDPQPGAGSCIFIHIWRSPTKGTAGCTAMAERDLDQLLRWLKKEDNPVMVQLPNPIYKQYWKELQLPAPELLADP